MSEEKIQDESAHQVLKAWLPRLLAFGVLILAMVPLFAVFRPLFGFLLLAISWAVLTSPLLFAPLDRLTERRFPNWASIQRRTVCGIGATACLVALGLIPLFPLLYASSGSVTEMLVGMAFGDELWRNVFLDHITEQVAQLKQLYPSLPIDEKQVRSFAEELVGEAREFSVSFLGYLFRGASGFLAEMVLSLMVLSFLYAHGTELTRALLKRAGFTKTEVKRLARLHRGAVLRLWSDTVMTAIVRGLCLGGVGSLVGDFPFWPVALLGAFAGLVPIVGAIMVWLPLATLAWSRGDVEQALLLALLSLVLNALVTLGKRRLGARLHDQGAWTSFLLFLSIIGGVLAYGVSGFVIGPASVIGVATLGRFFLPKDSKKMPALET